MNEFKKVLNSFLKDNAFIIALIVAAAIIITLAIVVIILNIKKKKNTVSTNKNNKKQTIDNYDDYITYLGGIENIDAIDFKGHRLVVVLKDYNKIQKEELKNLHINSIVLMSNKMILVNELDNNLKICDYIKSKLN